MPEGVTIKAPPEVLDEFAGITGLFADPRLGPMSPPTGDFGAPLSPNWNPSTPSTLGTNAPDVGTSALPPIQPASDMAPPAGPPGSVDYAQKKYAADVARPQPGLLGKIGGWASSILTPNVAAMIPSTPLGRIVEQRRDLGNLQQAETEQRAEQTAQSEEALRGAQTQETQARTAAMQNPPTKEDWKQVPGTNWELETGSGKTRQMQGVPAPEDKPGTFQEQTFDEWKQTHPNGTRMQFDKEQKANAQTPERGSFSPLYDPKTGAVTGAWNPTTGEMRNAPANLPGTTASGMTAQNKAAEAAQKQNQPYQDVLDKAEEAKEFAAQKTGPGDIGLVLAMVEATRPKAGFRMTQTEWNQILKARSSLGDVQALISKVESGQLLTDGQRKQMLDVIDIAAKMAKSKMSGGEGQGGKGGKLPEGAIAGTMNGKHGYVLNGEFHAD